MTAWTKLHESAVETGGLVRLATVLACAESRRQAFETLASFVRGMGLMDVILTIQTGSVATRSGNVRWSTLGPKRLSALDAVGFDGHDPIRRFARRSLDPIVWTPREWPGVSAGAGRAIMNGLRQIPIEAGMTTAVWGRGGHVAVVDSFGIPDRVHGLSSWDREMFHLAAVLAFRAIERVSLIRDGASLTEREIEILDLASLGVTTPSIAKRLDIVDQTVKFHLKSIRAKLGARNTSEAIARFAALDVSGTRADDKPHKLTSVYALKQ